MNGSVSCSRTRATCFHNACVDINSCNTSSIEKYSESNNPTEHKQIIQCKKRNRTTYSKLERIMKYWLLLLMEITLIR